MVYSFGVFSFGIFSQFFLFKAQASVFGAQGSPDLSIKELSVKGQAHVGFGAKVLSPSIVFPQIAGSYRGSNFSKGGIVLANWPTSGCC